MRGFIANIVAASLVIVGLMACNGSSPAAPPAPPATPQQDAATAGAGGTGGLGGAGGAGGAGATGGAGGAINSLFGTSGGSSTPSDIRSQQVTELKSEVDRLENEYQLDLQELPALQQSLTGVQSKVIPPANAPTLVGGLVGGIGDIGAGAYSSFASGSSTANGVTTETSNPAAGLSGFTAGFQSIGQGISGQIVAQQTANDVTAIGGSVQQEIAALQADMKNLQAQIQAKTAQIDALIAQGT